MRNWIDAVGTGGEVFSMKLYHGTTENFDQFDLAKMAPSGAFGQGFYFSNDLSLAKAYSRGGDPIAAIVTLQNPYVVNLDLDYFSDERTVQSRMLRPATTLRDRLIGLGHDGVLVKQKGYVEAVAYYPNQIEILGKEGLTESYEFDHEGWADDVDPDYESEVYPARLPATPENIARTKRFVMQKWIERAEERGTLAPPTDLSNSCKFSSLFAREIFGGRLRGHQAHQFVELDGRVLDLNTDALDVQQLGADAHQHDDEYFWGNPEHQEALDSCRPRVKAWVEEFLQNNN